MVFECDSGISFTQHEVEEKTDLYTFWACNLWALFIDGS
jgi:hypothetical protein